MPRATLVMRSLFYLLTVACLRCSNGQFPLLSSDRKAECQIDCSGDVQRQVCGTDGRTYDSKCEINRAKCEGHPVEFKHRGKCSEMARCTAQRSVAQAEARKFVEGVFIPECKEDGSYSEVQCHSFTGYCWCVNHLGKPIPGSSIRYQRPNCAQPGETRKRNNRRRSSHINKKKGCSNNDRSLFNTNLINLFKSEYLRIFHTMQTDNPLETEIHRVIQWKFGELDKNQDDNLRRREIKDLRRMAKKIVKPRSCAKTFTKYCDLDQDKKITRKEWSACLGVDMNKEQAGKEEDQVHILPTVDSDELQEKQKPILKNEDNTGEMDDAENDIQDCLTARKIALETHRQDPNGKVYIPSCTQQGLYVREQCHKSAGYCWCVHPNTGKPIRGTATHGIPPDCRRANRKSHVFKGCSLQKRQSFLEELLNSIEEEVNETVISSISVSKKVEEMVKWKFRYLDNNQNQLLDKKEWLEFRHQWKNFLKNNKRRRKLRKLRKCWRNFPRFCDINNNNKITMEEWMTCTGIIRNDNGAIKRRGPNPFDKILISD
ncbi:SPARC-related modular calcium-binding protein 2-like isoform X4 [Centruroides vittatus]|uniref:SPARC-related modular calcium-binding protein 2-like isoform X4 n=1 Tax=Centruroides vittatus TaxID=120091 RepID=UPI0035106F35